MHSAIGRSWLCTGIALAIVPILSAAPKNRKTADAVQIKDNIEVVAHLPLPGGPAVNLLAAVHWRHNYLYVEHGTQGAVTILDVTDPRTPKAAGEFVPPAGLPVHLGQVEGSVAMFSGAQPAAHAQIPESVVIVSFEDPAHPQVVRQFAHVACLLQDSARSLTYLINDDGLWVLHTVPGPDRQLEEEYDRYLKTYR